MVASPWLGDTARKNTYSVILFCGANSSCLFIILAMNMWFHFSLLAIRIQMILFWGNEKMHNLLCSSSAHYFFGSLSLSDLNNLISALALMRGASSWTSYPGFFKGWFNCLKNLDVGMTLLQRTIFQGLAVTIFSRLIQHIHIQGFIFEAIHHSTFPVHSKIIQQIFKL